MVFAHVTEGATSTTITLTSSSSSNTSEFGVPVTFSANVTGGNLTGTATFKDGTTTLGTGFLLFASGTTRVYTYYTGRLGVGAHSITAVYGGANNSGSTSSALTHTVTSSTSTYTTVFYQPTPYPTTPPEDQAIDIVHLWDGWAQNGELQRDGELRVGGDQSYRTYIKLDTKGLPLNVSEAKLRLRPFTTNLTPTRMRVKNVKGTWNTQTALSPQSPFAGSLGETAPPSTANQWYDIDITEPYNKGWMPNGNRLELYPEQIALGAFNAFRSSRHSDDKNFRPGLQLTFAPTLQLRMPLPETHEWLVTTEIGGYDCLGMIAHPTLWPDSAHTGTNYFSIDFSWRNNRLSGTNAPTIYTETSNDIPILAAASGKVVFVGSNEANGNYVVINHSGETEETPGFTTRYLHLKDPPLPPLVSRGDDVAQGQQIGVMGKTGRYNTGVHLHFGVRYNNSGAETIPELTKVVMEGQLLKSYQTECSAGSLTPNRYYRSSNSRYMGTHSGQGVTINMAQSSTTLSGTFSAGNLNGNMGGFVDSSGRAYTWAWWDNLTSGSGVVAGSLTVSGNQGTFSFGGGRGSGGGIGDIVLSGMTQNTFSVPTTTPDGSASAANYAGTYSTTGLTITLAQSGSALSGTFSSGNLNGNMGGFVDSSGRAYTWAWWDNLTSGSGVVAGSLTVSGNQGTFSFGGGQSSGGGIGEIALSGLTRQSSVGGFTGF